MVCGGGLLLLCVMKHIVWYGERVWMLIVVGVVLVLLVVVFVAGAGGGLLMWYDVAPSG